MLFEHKQSWVLQLELEKVCSRLHIAHYLMDKNRHLWGGVKIKYIKWENGREYIIIKYT